ncbi:MAG: hypothetical protein IT324_31505 [Anaerolineae bacterium]|nr:hypothetical protein [Anaerolineae bacterium]
MRRDPQQAALEWFESLPDQLCEMPCEEAFSRLAINVAQRYLSGSATSSQRQAFIMQFHETAMHLYRGEYLREAEASLDGDVCIICGEGGPLTDHLCCDCYAAKVQALMGEKRPLLERHIRGVERLLRQSSDPDVQAAGQRQLAELRALLDEPAASDPGLSS